MESQRHVQAVRHHSNAPRAPVVLVVTVLCVAFAASASGGGTGRTHTGTFPGTSGALATVSDRASERDIWSIHADGTELRRLTHGGSVAAPTYSADGRRLLYNLSHGGTIDIWMSDERGRRSHRLIADGADAV